MASQLETLRMRLDGAPAAANDALLKDALNSAGYAILARRYPFGYADGTEVPDQYYDLQVRIAVEMISHMGAEGQLAHTENTVQRTWESGSVSESLLSQIVPKVGIPG